MDEPVSSSQEARNTTKGRHVDDEVKFDAVARAKKAKNRQALLGIAKEIGVHETTLTGWMKNQKYSRRPKNTAVSKFKASTVSSLVRKAQTAPAKNNGSTPSLRDVIANLPKDYDGLLREHIKLLLERE